MLTKEMVTEQLSRAVMVGSAIVIGLNGIALVVVHYLARTTSPAATIPQLLLILYLVAIVDIAVAVFLKQKVFRDLRSTVTGPFTQSQVASAVMRAALISAAICGAVPMYGVVAFLLGADARRMAVFAIISLAGFMLSRPRQGDLNFFLSH